MTIGSLVAGVLALLVLLLIAGALGGVGSIELGIWVVLVLVWIVCWLVSRRDRSTTL